MFNLPASKKVCGMSCPGCYAIREQRYPIVVEARKARYTASQRSDFSDTIISELTSLRKRPKYFRIHASGEFYSQAYIDSWNAIVKANPDIIFYAYTKRLAQFDFSSLSELNNFILIDSLHFGKLNYGPIDSAPKDAFICPSATAICGDTCTYCMTKEAQLKGVYFVQH